LLLLRGLLYVRTEFLCADPNALQPLPHHVFRQTLAIADGAIIGTSLKVDGITLERGGSRPGSPADGERSRDPRLGRRPRLSRPPIEAVVFDMDGLLIDTEPVWRVAEVAVFTELGVELTEAELLGSIGRTIDEAVPVWRRRQPGRGVETDQLSDATVADRVIDRVATYVRAEGEPMAGVLQTFELLRHLGLRVAIASSSPRRLIDVVCERLDLTSIEVRCSAIDEVRGKPAPDVYLTAARRLNTSPGHCLAIEDSPSGVQAAKAAGMRCIAVPDPLLADDPHYRNADLVLDALTGLNEETMRSLGWAE
jgi:sugar-phosphatase